MVNDLEDRCVPTQEGLQQHYVESDTKLLQKVPVKYRQKVLKKPAAAGTLRRTKFCWRAVTRAAIC